MKLKLRADKKDLMAFCALSIFLLYVIAVCLLNVTSLIENGVPTGLNPLGAFNPRFLPMILGMWVCAMGVIFGSTSSYFFTFEKGFGYTSEKKEDGYSRWAKAKEIMDAKAVEKVPFLDKESKFGGVPLVYDKENAYVDNGESHTLVLGATGSGKTAGIINPTMKMLMKARESMIISDPKGEIYEDNSGLLRELGYEIIILNFREPQKGNCWNPYHLPYKFQKEGNFDKANELLNDLSTNIVVSGKGSDPFWEESASSYLTGLSLALFEDAKPEEININSVNLMMTTGDERYGASTYLKEYFNAKDPSSPACVNALGTVNAPNETKGSIVSVLKQKVKTLAVTKNLSEMLSKNDFEMDTIGEKPTAVFMIIQDEKTTYHSLATIFIKQCYESLISVAHKHGGALPVRVNFLLDEFANMPKFKDITTMVTAARSRRIRFLFIIQNFAQLKEVYGDHDAETIRGNCANIIYLLTGELAALEEISKLCGDKLVKVGKDKKEETRPLVTISELQRMKDDEIILIKHRCPPFKGKIKKDYESDFGFGKGSDNYGKNVIYPEREMSSIEMFDLKEFVRKQKQEKMQANMPGVSGNNPGGVHPPFPPGMPGFPGGMPNGGMPDLNSPDFDIDKMIRDIDAKIAELEKEEEEEKRKQAQKEQEQKQDEKKEEKQTIIKPTILDDDDPILKQLEENRVKPEEPKEISDTISFEKIDFEDKKDDVVDSNKVNFEDFSIKEEPKQEKKEESPIVNKVETDKVLNEPVDNNDDYDDFFDDFFFED